MTDYTGFCGIDIGKFRFTVAFYGSGVTFDYDNSTSGIAAFMKAHERQLKGSLCVLETTGGYEMELLYTLCQRQITVHRADTRKVKYFIRSLGTAAKTDSLDAKALARYGCERHASLSCFTPASGNMLELLALMQRRNDLRQMLVAEKNRLQGPGGEKIKESCQAMITLISSQITDITACAARLVQADATLAKRQETLQSIPGIGAIVSLELLILLPELGSLDRRKIAALAGLAPLARDSGNMQGYRKTAHGRQGIKPALFLAAMAARNSHSTLKDFYETLIKNGKKKMVALTALMRKILVIANAKLKIIPMQTT